MILALPAMAVPAIHAAGCAVDTAVATTARA